MKLDDYYEALQIPDGDRIPAEKNTLLIVPSKDYDISAFLIVVGVGRHEVAVTWPKDGVDLLHEVMAATPKVVVQLEEQTSKRFIFVPNQEDVPADLKKRIREAVTDSFVCLHHHDEYSLKDGLGTVEQLVKILKKQRRSYCAVTNHGSVGGWIRQYNACRKAGIKPIFGMEAYVSNYRGDDPEEKKLNRSANHLIVMAANQQGFNNIIQIHNDAQLEGFYYSPRADHEHLKKWGDGVIGTSACMAGEIPRFLMEDKFDEAADVYEFYRDAFSEFYIELQIIEFEMQREVNRRLVEFADAVGAPVILACDSHYLDKDHAFTHDLLMYIRQGKTIDDVAEKDEDVWDFDVRNLFYRDDSQMSKVFINGFTDKDGGRQEAFEDDVFTKEVFEKAMANSLDVARRIEDIKMDSTVKLPKLYKDSEGELRTKVNEGFKRLGLGKMPNKKEYLDRIRYEFGVICKLGWADYFLIMERIVTMAKAEFYDEVGEWVIGYGRGSAAGCLISWCLGLTDCDPIEHSLLFERFLDEGRPDPPDIDTDFHPAIRQRVKDRIVEMFGEEYTCSIGTYTSYKTKAAIQEIAKVLGKDTREAAEVTKPLESLRSFETEDGDDEIVDKMSLEELRKHYPKLDAYFKVNPDVMTQVEVIRNQVKNMGKHAGGVIISDMDLRGKIPVQRGGDGNIISSWAESGSSAELSQVGLVKYDILGLNNLPIISDCIRLVEQHRGEKIKRAEIPLDDHKTIRLESRGDLKGIFQFENPATKPIVDAVGMESLNDVSAITSLLRPGPKDMGMDMLYAERKQGAYYEVLPCLEWIFKDTYGIMVYQEQMMQISQALCGFDGPMANKLRKACGKKIKELMVSIRQAFVDGAQPKIEAGEVTLEEVVELWDLIVAFARYGFNKSHAVTYSMITTAELWLKHNYFREYMTALLINTKSGKKGHGGGSALVGYANYARKRGVEVLPVNINAPEQDFYIDGPDIVFGMSHVRGVASAAKKIVEISKVKPFESMLDFYERCVYETVVKSGQSAGTVRQTRPSKEVVENLIYAGAFDEFGERGDMLRGYFIARLGIPQPTDDELDKAQEVVLPKGAASPDVNDIKAAQTTTNPRVPLAAVKGVGEMGDSITMIAEERSFASMADFYERCVFEAVVKSGKNEGTVRQVKPNKKVVTNLIYAGAFDRFGDRRKVFRDYYIAKAKMADISPTDSELESCEMEVLGLCLSREPLFVQYATEMSDNRWTAIGDHEKSDKLWVFGRIESIEPRTSKSSGNPMLGVTISDGMDSLYFFVFMAGIQQFRDKVKKGMLAAIPMGRFEDSFTRFYDDRREIHVQKEIGR